MQQLRGAVSGLLLLVMVLGVGGCVEGTGGANRSGEKPKGGYLPARDNYHGVSVVDRDHAWVVGQRGLILHLTEGGRRVELQEGGLPRSWYSASFVDAQNGLISGEFGTILRTRDGGKQWEPLPLDLPVPKEEVIILGADPTQDRIEFREGALPHIFALARAKTNPLHVWGVGDRSTVVHSADGGETWENLSLGKDIILNGADFISETEGWVVGEFGIILHTTDGGHTWEEQTEVLGLPKYIEPDVTDEEAYLSSIPRLYLEDLYFYDVRFANSLEGYAVGLSGFILHTTDGGKTWRYTPGDTYDHLFKIALLGKERGSVSGAVGTLLVKEPEKWWQPLTAVQEHVFTWLRDVDFAPDGLFGVACGGNGTILVSEDGGLTWGKVPTEVLELAGTDAQVRSGS